MSEVPVKPTGWRMLIDPIEIPEMTEGGIALPDEHIKAQQYLRYAGTVLAMGDLCYSDPKFADSDGRIKPWCTVGDIVTFGRHAGQPVIVKQDGEPNQYRLMNDDEIMAVISDASALVFDF